MSDARAVVSEAALRELLREALSNVGAMGHDAPPPVEPNPSMDRPSLELDFDPIEVKAVPRNRNELVIMVRNLLDGVDDDQSGELYKKIKALVGGDQAGTKDFAKAAKLPSPDKYYVADDNKGSTDMKNMGESKLIEAWAIWVDDPSHPAHSGYLKIGEDGELLTFNSPQEANAYAAQNVKNGRSRVDRVDENIDVTANVGGARKKVIALRSKGESKLVEAIKRIITEVGETADDDAPASKVWKGPSRRPYIGQGTKMGLGGQIHNPAHEEEGPFDDFVSRGGSASDEMRRDMSPSFNPDEDIIDDDERDAALAALTKSAWDPDEDDDNDALAAAPTGKKSPKPRVDVGTGYGVDGETYEKIGEKLGFTKEAAKKAVSIAMERFKALHDLGPDELADMVEEGVDEYIAMLTKTGELTPEDVKFLHDNAEQVTDSDSFREYFAKYVKKLVREERADTQDDDE